MDSRTANRSEILCSFGVGSAIREELLLYNASNFEYRLSRYPHFPLPDEDFVSTWETYAKRVARESTIMALAGSLAQLNFPVAPGMSENADYQSATRRGMNARTLAIATGLPLRAPDRCRVLLHSTPAGRIPAIVIGEREDFVLLVQALSGRNEPVPVPASMGACVVTGYNNWDRVRLLRERFEAVHPATEWAEEFKRVRSRTWLYQDTFLLLGTGPYSGVSAPEAGYAEGDWRYRSHILRTEHEAAHYFTRRVFGSARNHLIDELVADFYGMAKALGSFKAELELRFLGVENYPYYRNGGRLQNYRGDPPLSDAAFGTLQQLVVKAAENLEVFDAFLVSERKGASWAPALLSTLCQFTVEELAARRAASTLREAFRYFVGCCTSSVDTDAQHEVFVSAVTEEESLL